MRRLAANRDDDITQFGCGKARALRDAHRIRSGWKQYKAIVAFVVGRGLLLQSGILINGGDGDARDARALRVEYAPFDVAGAGLRLRAPCFDARDNEQRQSANRRMQILNCECIVSF